ncbi:hypothetical protein E2E30_02820 [Sphingomonas sp. AAP5]|nr:hypothetical protein E2E30_02820 [Sphingomonas sp. AAP5]
MRRQGAICHHAPARRDLLGERRAAAEEAALTRTKLSVCQRKRRFADEAAAAEAIVRSGLVLRSYRCDRCRQFHLTSRTKGKRVVGIGTVRGSPHPAVIPVKAGIPLPGAGREEEAGPSPSRG